MPIASLGMKLPGVCKEGYNLAVFGDIASFRHWRIGLDDSDKYGYERLVQVASKSVEEKLKSFKGRHPDSLDVTVDIHKENVHQMRL